MADPVPIHQEIPHDDAIERATLGAIILQPSRIVEIADLSPLAFWIDRNRTVFVNMAACVRRHGTIDLPLLKATLQDAAKLDAVGGPVYLATLLDGGVRGANLAAYAEHLRDLEMRRSAIQGAAQVASLARSEGLQAASDALRRYASTITARAVWEPQALDMARLLEDTIPAVPWLVEGWLGRGDLATLAGEWATGKSIIAMDLAISVAANLPWMGRVPVAFTCPVLYLDEENNPHNAHRRFARMVRGRNIDPLVARELPVRYLCRNRINLDDKRSRDQIRKELDRTRAGLLVLDSLVRFHRRNENKADDMAAFYADALSPFMAEFNCAILTLDHMRKPNEGDEKADIGHRIRGSGDKAGVADDVWTLEGDRDGDRRTLSCRKNRWEDTLPPAMSTRWVTSEDETAAWIETSDAALQVEIIVSGILASAGDAGVRAGALYEALAKQGVARSTAIRTVKKLVKSDTINSRNEGKQGVRYWPGNVPLRSNP